MRHSKKEESMTHVSGKKNQVTETAYENDQVLDLIEETLKVVFINTSKKLKETMTKEVKEDVITKLRQIEYINKKIEIIQGIKWKFWS